MKFALDQLTAAYSGFLKWIGFIVGSVAVLNWLVVTLDMNILGALSTLIDLYQTTFYPLFFVPEWLFDFSIPDRLKDIFFFYTALGGVTSRTWQGLLAKTKNAEEATIGDYSEPVGMKLLSQPKGVLVRPFFLIVSFLLWPLFMRPFIRRPILAFSDDELQLWLPSREYQEIVEENGGKEKLPDWTTIDARLVWALQVFGMIFAALSAIGLHEFLTGE